MRVVKLRVRFVVRFVVVVLVERVGRERLRSVGFGAVRVGVFVVERVAELRQQLVRVLGVRLRLGGRRFRGRGVMMLHRSVRCVRRW